MPTQRGFRKAAVATVIGAVAILAAACSSNSSSSTTTTRGLVHDHGDRPRCPTTVIPTQPANAAIAATVPVRRQVQRAP